MEIAEEINNTFELRSKKYFFTYPQCELPHGEILGRIKRAFDGLGQGIRLERWIVARESHAQGGHHLHCYIEISKAIRRRVASNLFDEGNHHPNIQGVRSCRAVIAYVSKDGDYITNDQKLVDTCKEKWGESKREIAKRLLAGVKLPDMLKEHPELLFGYSRLKCDLEAAQADTMAYPPSDGPIGLWLGGKSGVGKSHFARVTVPEGLGLRVHSKPNNEKFWMGYLGEEIIVAEDVGKSWLPEPFKIWGDKWEFIGETKGGYKKIKPKWFIVTSNYNIDEWLTNCGVPDEYQERLPWLRRFREYYVTDRDEFADILKFMKD